MSINKDIDYICFADCNIPNNRIWKLRLIPKELSYLNDVKKQRIVKICPHRYLKEYDVSIWIDGNFQIVGDIQKFISQYDLSKNPFYTRVHPSRRCIYEEAQICIKMHKDARHTIEQQVNRYRNDGYPKNIGMVETGIILRRHNEHKCQLLGNLWASELLNGSCRDQLSFNYACWKMHFLPGCLNNEFNACYNSTFRLCQHGQ